MFFSKRLTKVLPKKLAVKLRNSIASTDYKQSGSMREIFKKVVTKDLEHLLPKIDKRTLILWGSSDKVLDVNMAKTFRDKIPHTKIKIFWGADHNLHLEREDEFVEAVKDFLDA